MGSDVNVTVDGPPELLDVARDRIDVLERRWSRFLPDSEISTLNGSGDWIDVSPDTQVLVDRSVAAWELTGGRFDPTILPSLVAAGYRESRSERPGRTTLPVGATPGRAPGLGAIELDGAGGRIRFPADVMFDPGGIGKGLAADLVAEELVAAGAGAAVVSVGGDVRVAGRAPGDWSIAVEDPFDPNRTIAELTMSRGAVCTSSILAKTWVTADGPRHHLVDPRTGTPAATSTVSATVVTADAWVAEALCTLAILTEPVDALGHLESMGVAAIVVDRDGLVWRTPGLERYAA